MKKDRLVILVLLIFQSLFSQSGELLGLKEEKINVNAKKKLKNVPLDSIRNMYGARYVDYKMITHQNDTVQIDTTLTIKKYFKHNYLQKDDFEYLHFSNQGQTFNRLGYHFVNNDLTPIMGITGKQSGLSKLNEIEYFNVPTPTTKLFYKSGIDGQVLNSIFTTNFGKNQNFSIAYKGLRSTGDYLNQASSHKQFKTTYSYYNPKKRYQFRLHIVDQEISHQENGGLTDVSVAGFKDDDDDFSVRSRVDVNLYNSESAFKSTRYYFEHELRILNSKDSLKTNLTNLKIGHSIRRTINNYKFQSEDIDYFQENLDFYGAMINEEGTSDSTEQTSTKNEAYLKFKSPYILGNFKVFTALENYTHFYDSSTIVDEVTIGKEIDEVYSSFGASWKGKLKGVFINAHGEQLVSGGNLGSNLHVNAGFHVKKSFELKGGLQLKTSAPNSVYNLYQSNFSNFNWTNNFENEIHRTLYGSIKTPWLNAEAYAYQIENYAYFDASSVASQYTNTIDYLKLKLSNEFKFGKFRLNNTLLLQSVSQGAEVFRVPKYVTRNTFYYQSYFFKGNPLLAQIGFTFKYFDKYYANDFNTVLNEFYLQNNTEIGGYPTLDVFVNAEVRRTRIYFSLDNVTADFSGRNYFATSNQPQKDLTIRLGLVWNFWN